MMYQLKKVREAITHLNPVCKRKVKTISMYRLKEPLIFDPFAGWASVTLNLHQHMTAVLYLQKTLKANPRCTQAQQLLSE